MPATGWRRSVAGCRGWLWRRNTSSKAARGSIRDGDRVFRTYFIDARGDEALGSTWSYLDMTALGRQEAWEDSPEGYPQTPTYEWWIWHDEPQRTDPDRTDL